jgi:predicted ATPase
MEKQTNWFVITGGPSSGKTTAVEYLTLQGFAMVPESARLLINMEKSQGKTIEEIRADEAEFQKRVFKMKVEAEKKIKPERVTFFDRGIPDSIAYYQLCNLDPAPVIKASRKRRYKKIFFLEQLPFSKDYARTENNELAQKLSEMIYKAYEMVGYNLILVPGKIFKKRIEFILSKI